MFNKNHILLLISFCALLFCFHLDSLYVNIMEARNFITAREMLQDDHWLLTTMNGLPRYEKPPLPTWLTAFSGAIFGLDNLTTLRLPAAIMGILLVVFHYGFIFKLTAHRKLALIGALVLSTSFYILYAARNGQWDIFTHGFMMGSIYYLYQLLRTSSKNYLNAILAGIFFGLSVLSKGLVSLYALWIPFVIAFGIVYHYKGLRTKALPLSLFIIVATIVSTSWYNHVYYFDNETVLAIAEKEISNWKNSNVRPFYYYWSFIIHSGLWTIPAFMSLLYPYLKDKVRDKKAYTFTLLWTLFSVLLLSIIPEKKSRYLLPVLIPLAANTSFYIEYLFRKFVGIKDWREKIPVYVHFGSIAIIGLVVPIAGYLFLQDQTGFGWAWFIALSVTLFALGILIIRYLFRRNIEKLFMLSMLFIAAILCFGMPLTKTFTYNSAYKSLAQLPAWEKEHDIKSYEFSNATPELIWAYQSSLTVLLKKNEITYPQENRFAVLVIEERINLFKEAFKDYHIEKVDRYDMNAKGAEDRSHKMRLWRDLYLVTTKKTDD